MHINHSEFDLIEVLKKLQALFCPQVQENYYQLRETPQIATFDGLGVGFGKFFM